jgi:hypothetical protein
VLRSLEVHRIKRCNDSRAILQSSPPINFSSFYQLDRLLITSGLPAERDSARTALCGYLIDRLIRHGRLVAWNARIADRLPVWCASGWMFQLHVLRPARTTAWRRGIWASWRKRLNERRWGVA